MPYSRFEPFSSVDGLSDDQWADNVAQWKAAQDAGFDPVAATQPQIDPGFSNEATPPDATAALRSAAMPHDQWQLARAQQLAARGGDDGSAPHGAPQTDSPDAQREAQLAAFQTLMAAPSEEGRRNDVYLDSRGIPTVGIGHRVLPKDNLRVGQRISDPQVDAYFQQDGRVALDNAMAQAKQAGITDPDFVNRLAAVNFQLGSKKWPSTFPKTWGLILSGDYSGAADELNNSDWVHQTPRRVDAFAKALRSLPPRTAP